MSRISLTSSSSTNTVSPSKPTPPSEVIRVKPNPHPYAIKTTSTAVLSGSHAATTVSSPSQSPYHYVPASPSPSPTKPTHSHGRGSRHRYSRSLTSDELPRPLPVPPSPDDDNDHDVFQSSRPSLAGSTQTRRRRSETLPGLPFPRLSLTDDSTNPKRWSPAELAAHLASTLDMESGLPINEITAFVVDSEITGMSFLRFDDGVLNAYGVDQKWRPALLTASRTLRQNVLRMGLPSSTVGPSTSQHRGPTNTNGNRRVSRSANSSPTRPFTYPHPRYSTTTSSASSAEFFYSERNDNDHDDEDLAYMSSSSRSSISSTTSSLYDDEDRNVTRRRRYKLKSKGHGRVRGMVASFERSNSILNEHNQSPTRSDSKPGRELERGRNSSTYGETFPAAATAAIPTTFTGNSRPLPKAPHLAYSHTGTGTGAGNGNGMGIGLGPPPLLLPSHSSPASLPYASAMNTPHTPGNGNGNGTSSGSRLSGNSTSNGISTYLHTQHTGQRPLPMPPNDGYIPLLQSLPLRSPLPVPPAIAGGQRSVSGSTTGDSIYMSASEGEGGGGDADGDDGDGKKKEMTMQVLLEMLGEDADVGPGGTMTMKNVPGASRKGALVPPAVPPAAPVPAARTATAYEGDGDEEMTVDELLALTEGGAEKRTGAEAWEIDYGIGETVKRVPISEAGAGAASEYEGKTVGGGSGMGSGRIGRSVGRSLGKTDLKTNMKTKGRGMDGRRRVDDLFNFGGQDEAEGQDPKANADSDEPRAGGDPSLVAVVDLAEKAKEMEHEMERERARLLALEVEQERERMVIREQELRERELREQELREQELRERELREREAVQEREAARERERELELQLAAAGVMKEIEVQQRVHEEQERRLILEEREREYVLLLGVMDQRQQEMQRDLERERVLGEREAVLLGEMGDARRALEVLGTRVAEVERKVEELEGVVRKREEREREERKLAEEVKKERRRREEGGISQTMLRNMKMLALAWSISIPAFISSPSSTSSRSTSADSTSADTDTDSDTDTIRNGNRNERRNRRTSPNRVTRRQFEQLYDSLPRYVLLVGIGACAFVLRGLVRRVWALGVGGAGGRGMRR